MTRGKLEGSEVAEEYKKISRGVRTEIPAQVAAQVLTSRRRRTQAARGGHRRKRHSAHSHIGAHPAYFRRENKPPSPRPLPVTPLLPLPPPRGLPTEIGLSPPPPRRVAGSDSCGRSCAGS